jgi:hypothetical protein
MPSCPQAGEIEIAQMRDLVLKFAHGCSHHDHAARRADIVLTGCASSATQTVGQAPTASGLHDGGRPPAFRYRAATAGTRSSLDRHAGPTADPADEIGRAVVVEFIYATCPGRKIDIFSTTSLLR